MDVNLTFVTMKTKQYHLSFYVPAENLEAVKTAIFKAGAGYLGNYEYCAWQTKGVGQFRPTAGAQPAIGKIATLERLVEYKVEIFCEESALKQSIAALKNTHPYEEVAYAVVEIIH